ncbi:hypothetical protein FOA52_008290 [Chlamydomonas sp. UWO 241]|nr:hypothetical protein FOA52_008290 [Chlamydomonas sp. UWO 241]
MEPSLDPALEAQAAARVHRMGQTKPTRIVRLVTAQSVEQAVLTLQATKPSSGLQLLQKGNGGGGDVQESVWSAVRGGRSGCGCGCEG